MFQGYRLHIDIPLGDNREESIQRSEKILKIIQDALVNSGDFSGTEVNYRLGNDTDRQKSNHLDINHNGHCSNKKLTFSV